MNVHVRFRKQQFAVIYDYFITFFFPIKINISQHVMKSINLTAVTHIEPDVKLSNNLYIYIYIHTNKEVKFVECRVKSLFVKSTEPILKFFLSI